LPNASLIPLTLPGSRELIIRTLLTLRLLAYAVHQAGLGPHIRRQGPVPRTGSRQLGPRARAARVLAARRWLLGELDDQVALPIGYVCDMLGLDAGVLAAAARARVAPAIVAGDPWR